MELVRVYLDGEPRDVPHCPENTMEAREALGVQQGWAVAYESDPQTPLRFDQGHIFYEGERYVTLDTSFLFEEDDGRQEPWARDPDAWKGGSE